MERSTWHDLLLANKGLKQVRMGDDHGTTREYNQPAPAVLVGARVWLAAWIYG
jgi:hypothetical protein